MADSGTREQTATQSRRRGAVLEQAIYQATLRELTTLGYNGLTMEGVARRAQTGKAALYRRWPSKKDLVLDALLHTLPQAREITASNSARDNLIAALTIMSDTLAGEMATPGLGVMLEMLREPELRQAFGARVVEPRLRLVEAILHRAAARGELRADAELPLIARTGPALVMQTFLLTGMPPAAAELSRIVDAVLMPLLAEPGRSEGGSGA
ncbi:TetR/AcrR family transcriptional regulator [Nonomuraea sp. NPDC049158]|uniref:TetR/AcrR family transcriptional regulator n=1 Tax=Nonomuraea sp. NPDC049158 TaxID=3155649 RepID=UPI0033E43608